MQNYIYKVITGKENGVLAKIIGLFLLLLSLLYSPIVRLLAFLGNARRLKFNLKVVSVGNITWGGTGKTSLVELAARYLSAKGKKIVVLSRGYKSRLGLGDEPYMLSQNLKGIKVLAGSNREALIKGVVKEGSADTVILDDAFQQWHIKKNLNILTIDAVNPFGNGHLIPRGILREPLGALRRADIFIITKTNLNPDIEGIRNTLKKINSKADIFEAWHRVVGFYNIQDNQDAQANSRAAIFSGIADPDSFEELVKKENIEVALRLNFRDHYNYTQKDLYGIIEKAKTKNLDTIITTEKDAARIKEGGLNLTKDILILRIKLEIKNNEEEFYNRLSGIYNS